MSWSVFPEVFFVIVFTYIYIFSCSSIKKDFSKKVFRFICSALLILFAAVLLWITLFNRNNMSEQGICYYPFNSYMVVTSLYNSVDVFTQIADNILIFIPLGMLLPVMCNVSHSKKSYFFVVLTGLAISLIIEILQYALAVGYSEVDDIINNTFGTAIGCGFFALTGKIETKNGSAKLKKGWRSCILPAEVFIIIMGTIWCYREYVLYPLSCQ